MLLDEVLALRQAVVTEGDAILAHWRPRIGRLSFLPSARNLAAYLAFRKHDVQVLQEEILWLAEAAHTPVVWATQVLDRLVRKGTPSRAEISDVVLAQRAECVMLNKGEFLLDALSIVDEVCRRMDTHQHKKTARLRALRAWS